MNAWHWVIFNLIILIFLAFDLLVVHRKAHVVTLKESLSWSSFWILLALLFDGYIFFAMGKEPALNFLSAYLIEKSLSVDNLFVFLLLFDYFNTPESSQHKVLFWGILGAMITRVLFIFIGVALVQRFHFVIYIFGFFLIFTGLRLLFEKKKQIHPEKNFILNFLRRFVSITSDYEKNSFFVSRNNKIFATPLFVVLIAIESTDIIFAADSIPAILSISYDPFILYTSNILAILGLRSLFFVVAKTFKLFKYLHYGVCVILIFVGVKMLLTDVWIISPFVSLAVIAVIVATTIILSLRVPKE